LELGRDARTPGSVDQGAALRRDARGGLGLGRVDLGPDPRGIWIEPEDDLGGALRDRRGEAIGEALPQVDSCPKPA
jgi:hypothetical protein